MGSLVVIHINKLCAAALNIQINKTWTVYLPSPKVALPVIKKLGEIEWITWGERKEENLHYFPNGGWARLDSIHVSFKEAPARKLKLNIT